MTLTTLSNILEKMYNTLGNKYLTDNFITEPFDFKVKVIYDRDNDLYDYIITVYSVPDIPKGFLYKPEIRESKQMDGIHISVLKNKFKELYKYIGSGPKYVGVTFVNQEK